MRNNCATCESTGYVDWDYVDGRYVPYLECSFCVKEDVVETTSLVAPNVDEVAEAFERGNEAGFLAGLKASEDHGKQVGFSDARELVAYAYTTLIIDGLTQDHPIIHDVFEFVFKVMDGEIPVPDYKNMGSEEDLG